MKLHGYLMDGSEQYYVASFLASPQEKREILAWCVNTFGSPVETVRWTDRVIWGEVYFNNESDFNWFMMRWS